MVVRQQPPGFFRLSLFGTVVALCGWASHACAADRPAPDPEAGKAAYTQSCARCHGDLGKGDGVDAKRFYPRPRDLTLGVYKFRTTLSGTPPSDEDLFRTITDGLPGTNMPDWRHLSEATRWQLVAYLKSLSPVFEQAQPSPVATGEDPGPKRADLAKGRAVYEQLGCAACHGAAGRANGTSAAGLVDDWGMPIRPANLTQGWSFRGGRDARSILLRLLAGIDGAGMPSYAEAVSTEDAWQLAYYVASLQEAAHWNMVVRAQPAHGALPETPDDPRWHAAASTTVRTRNVVTPQGEWANPPTIRAVTMQVMVADDVAAFRLVWDDPTQEPPAQPVDDAEAQPRGPDGLALVFKPSGGEGDVVTLQLWPHAGSPALDVCAWTAGAASAMEAIVKDFDAARSPAAGQLPRRSAARYHDGRWELVVHRPLRPPQPDGAAVLAPGHFTAVAFAVWDGANPDARAVSPWVDVTLPALPAKKH